MKKLFFLLGLLLFKMTPIYGGHTDDVLSVFFENLLRETEAGYVFLGVKPLCTVDGCQEKALLPTIPNHAYLVAMWKGGQLWKKLDAPSSKVVIQIEGREGFQVYHEEYLRETIKKHQEVFQTIFGASLNEEELLQMILTAEPSFFSSTQGKIFAGLLLGYGLNNTLLGSRWEEIQEALFTLRDEPPFQSAMKKVPEMAHVGRHIILRPFPQRERSIADFKPGPRFQSLEEEFRSLNEKMEISSPTLLKNKPAFVFGRVKGDPEEELRIHQLEVVQKELQKQLEASDVLPFVWQQMFGTNEWHIEQQPEEKKNEFDIASLIARTLWGFYTSVVENTPTHDSFFRGLNNDQNGPSTFLWHPFHEVKRNILYQMVENYRLSERYFSSLAQDSSYHALIPSGIYFRVLNEGNGPRQLFANARLTYEVFDVADRRLTFQDQPTFMSLKDTLPGFGHAIQGMREGETREILLHPSYGYGIYTTLEKGMPIKCVVTLIKAEEGSTKDLPPLDPVDLSFLLEDRFISECERVWEEEAFQYGLDVREKLQAFSGVKTEDVVAHLVAFADEREVASLLSDEEKEALIDFYWEQYFGT